MKNNNKTKQPTLADVKLVAADMDNTLLLPDSSLPSDFFDYVNEMEKYGIVFAAASGRPYLTLREMFEPVLDKVYLMADNGAYIKKGERTVFKDILPFETAQYFLDFTLNNTNGIPFFIGLNKSYTINEAKPYEDDFKMFFRYLDYVDDLSEIEDEIDKFSIYFPDKNSTAYYDNLYKPEFGGKFYLTTGNEYFIDLQNKGIHKGKGLLEIGKDMDISTSEMMSFGDHMNDKEMVETAYFGYSMENATDRLKKISRFQAASNKDRGVLKEIDKILNKIKEM